MLLSEGRTIPNGLAKHFGEFMEDEQAERETPLWQTALAVLPGIFLTQYIFNGHVFHDQGLMAGLKTFRWDNILPPALGAIVLLRLLPPRPVRNKETTTLGLGRFTAKKLQ